MASGRVHGEGARAFSSAALRRRAGYTIAFCLVVAIGLGLTLHRLDEPVWEASHHGYVASEYPHNARNYLRFGYAHTGLGLVMDSGEVEPEGGFHYRVDHGFGLPVLISLAYALFGVHPWSARLVSVVLVTALCLLAALFTYRLSRHPIPPLIALWLCAAAPLQTYYGRLPSPHALCVLLSMAAFYAYWRWFTTRRAGYLAGIVAALVAGAFTDWIVYFAFPPILLHYLVFVRPRRGSWIVAFCVAPFALFGLYLAWVYAIAGEELAVGLLSTFLRRSGDVAEGGESFTRLQSLGTLAVRAGRWLTWPAVGAACAGWVSWSRRTAEGPRLTPERGIVAAMLLFGLLHNLMFLNRVMVHEFIMLRQFVVPVGVSAALALWWGLRRLPVSRPVQGVLLAGLAGATLLQSLSVYDEAHRRGIPYLPEVYVATELARTVPADGCFLDAADLDADLAGPRAYATADRAVIEVSTIADLRAAGRGCAIAVAANSGRTAAGLRAHLVEHHPAREVMDFTLFDLHESRSSVLADHPPIDHPRTADFGEIEFLGFTAQTEVVLLGAPASWIARYFNRHVDLAPHRITTHRVDNYWRRTTAGPTATDHDLVTIFTAEGERPFHLARRDQGLDRLYPSSRWPVGQVIRESFDLYLTQDTPTGTYRMGILARPAGTGSQDLAELQERTVEVGQLEIRGGG
jgi:hypothetical protein